MLIFHGKERERNFLLNNSDRSLETSILIKPLIFLNNATFNFIENCTSKKCKIATPEDSRRLHGWFTRTGRNRDKGALAISVPRDNMGNRSVEWIKRDANEAPHAHGLRKSPAIRDKNDRDDSLRANMQNICFSCLCAAIKII